MSNETRFVPKNWQNDPAGGTPITKDELNRMEKGIKDAHVKVGDIGEGPQGPVGPKGEDGQQGPQGVAGVDGAKGDTGAAGPKGDQGPSGPRGEQGADGKDGTGIALKGELTAASELPPTGSAGDAYLIAGHLHVWSGDKWTDAGNFQGPQGQKGPQGNAGSAGPKGDTGAKGDQGPQGKQGIQGPKGDTGATPSYGTATVTSDGLMSANDKKRLDAANWLPTAHALAKHDDEGHLYAKPPLTGEHVVNKDYADKAILNATANGRVLVPEGSANAPYRTQVSLPVGRFIAPPRITLTPMTAIPHQVSVGIDGITNQRFEVVLYRPNVSKTAVQWCAIIENTNVKFNAPYVHPEGFASVMKTCKTVDCGNKGHAIEMDSTANSHICGVCNATL